MIARPVMFGIAISLSLNAHAERVCGWTKTASDAAPAYSCHSTATLGLVGRRGGSGGGGSSGGGVVGINQSKGHDAEDDVVHTTELHRSRTDVAHPVNLQGQQNGQMLRNAINPGINSREQ